VPSPACAGLAIMKLTLLPEKACHICIEVVYPGKRSPDNDQSPSRNSDLRIKFMVGGTRSLIALKHSSHAPRFANKISSVFRHDKTTRLTHFKRATNINELDQTNGTPLFLATGEKCHCMKSSWKKRLKAFVRQLTGARAANGTQLRGNWYHEKPVRRHSPRRTRPAPAQ